MTTTLKVLVTGGKEFVEYIGNDGKRYLGRSTDGSSVMANGRNTIRKASSTLKYGMIPFSIYKKTVNA